MLLLISRMLRNEFTAQFIHSIFEYQRIRPNSKCIIYIAMTMTGCTNLSNLKKECNIKTKSIRKELEHNFGNQSSTKLRSLMNEPSKNFNKIESILKAF